MGLTKVAHDTLPVCVPGVRSPIDGNRDVRVPDPRTAVDVSVTDMRRDASSVVTEHVESASYHMKTRPMRTFAA